MSNLGHFDSSLDQPYRLKNLRILKPSPPHLLGVQKSTTLRTILRRGKAVDILEQSCKDMNLPGFDPTLWKAPCRLYFMEWLCRRWTFQESMLFKSSTVLCGDRFLLCDTFKELSLALADTLLLYHTKHIGTLPIQRQTESMPPFTRLGSFRYSNLNDDWFWYYVTHAQLKESKLREDRIYNSIGLAPEFIRREILIDCD